MADNFYLGRSEWTVQVVRPLHKVFSPLAKASELPNCGGEGGI